MVQIMEKEGKILLPGPFASQAPNAAHVVSRAPWL